MEITTNKHGNLELSGRADLGFDNGYTNESLGEHAFTMELFLHKEANKDKGSATIEWDIPSLEETEHIGVWWENGEVQGYDGVFDIPSQAIELLKHYGLDCTEIE